VPGMGMRVGCTLIKIQALDTAALVRAEGSL
jgi:hypothetical protein